MSITILSPDASKSRPFFIATQQETQAWGHGATEEAARKQMVRHKKYKAILEDASQWQEGVHLEPASA